MGIPAPGMHRALHRKSCRKLCRGDLPQRIRKKKCNDETWLKNVEQLKG
jgi:hypothetical protein